MENVTTTQSSTIKTLLSILCILFITVTFIVLAMPNTERPKLTYNIGEPWTSQQLISPGEILIQKDPKVVEQERSDALRNEYIPYYNCDLALAHRQVELFMEKYGQGIEGFSAYSIQCIADDMRRFYEQGIMAQTEYSQMLSEDSLAAFMRVDSKQATRVQVRNMLSTKQAYERITQDPRLVNVRELLSHLNINEYLIPNIIFDQRRSEQAKLDIIAMIPTNSGLMKQGQEIINRGDIVTEEKARMIDSYNDFITAESHSGAAQIMLTNGIQWLYVAQFVMLLMLYLHYFRRDYLTKPRSLAMLFTLITIFPVMNSLIMRLDPRNIYILPLCLVPMFIRVFLDSRTAFMAHTVMVLICAATVSDKFTFVAVQIASGIIAITALRELSKRSQILLAALFVTIVGVFTFTIMRFLDNRDITFEALKHYYFTFMFNGVLLLLTYPMMFIVEKLFGFISPVTLFELSDLNRDLLRRLSEVAPGTFNHSVNVSNLASAIASEIGGKSLLVRVAALYHDIGKITNPVFFTENQSGVNPHDRMTPLESAQIILGHVTEGIRIAEKNGVPDVITNFIQTHHGAGLVRFFYNTYYNQHPGEEVDEKPFRYAGPNPFSLEQAILMMADSVEAASRSLPEYTEESISNLVNRIIDGQVADGFFEECPITYRDISMAKRILIEKLKSMYHTRIQYPELHK